MNDRAGILIRVSTARQGERGASVETQRQDCMSYCERMGWLVAMIEEDHQTGTNFDRAGYQKLAKAAQESTIDKLVVWSLDRFGRGEMLSALTELRGFEDAGCEIHSVSDGGLVKNDLIRNVRLAIAEDFSRQLSSKVTRGLMHRAETGHWVALPPFGYDLIDCPDCGKGKKLTPNEQGAIVTEIARRFDAGQAPTDIREWLRNEPGLAVDVGWLKRRLTNPAYAGDVHFNRRGNGKFRAKGKRAQEDVVVTRDAHPALIARDVFERIQGRFQAPQTISRPTAKPYDGLLVCGQCGSRMYRVPGGKKPYHFYFACSNRHRFNTCDQGRVPYRLVEEALDAQMGECFPAESIKGERKTLFQRYLALIEPDIERLINGAAEVRSRLQTGIEKLGRQQDSVYEDRLEGRISPDFAARKLEDIQSRIRTATQELATVKNTGTAADWYRKSIGKYIEADDHAERELLRLLVARIVADGDALSIDWTDYAQSLARVTDGTAAAAPSACPGAASRRRCISSSPPAPRKTPSPAGCRAAPA